MDKTPLGLNSKELLVVNILSDKRIQIFCQPRNKYHSKIENSFKWCFRHVLLPIRLWDYCIYFAAQFTILFILRPPLGTVLLSFFTITSGIIITTSKQVGQRNVTAKKQSDGNLAFLRSPHISDESPCSRLFGGWLFSSWLCPRALVWL